MKLLTLFFLFTMSISFAREPFNLCSLDGYCSKAQEKIFEQFDNCNSFNIQKVATDYVWSGSCYHVGGAYQKDKEHFGVAYFDQRSTDFRYAGVYSFYTKGNNHKDMTPEEAQVKFSHQLDLKKQSLNLNTDDYAYLIFPHEDKISEIEYWFKSCSEKLFVLGHWGYKQQLICEFNKN